MDEIMSADDELNYRLHEMNMSTERPLYSRPKIQIVANDLRERTDYKSHYLPTIVSMGPIHHGNPELQIGEEYKLIWAKKYIQKAGTDSKDLHRKIVDNLATLKSFFADDVLTMASNTIGNFRSFDQKLTWMLFVDGYSLLYILDIDNDFENEETIMKLVSRDVLLLENQLPLGLLYLLANDGKNRLNLMERIIRFLKFNHVVSSGYKLLNETPTHLLDLVREMLLPNHEHKITVHQNLRRRERISNSVVRYMNIQELKSNGIRIKSSESSIIDMSFSHRWLIGELTLPEIVLDDLTISIFLNLIAYEMCPDFRNDYGISTFLAFINSLIRVPEDVKDLRLAGILFSNYGTDDELIKLFHFITTDVVSNAKSYSHLFGKINKHMANKWKTKTVRFLRYIRHPWTNFAVHATELALALAVIQTWFTVNPVKS